MNNAIILKIILFFIIAVQILLAHDYQGMNFKLEICIDNVASGIDAQNAGADRVELCASLPEGGTTPGYGTIIFARRSLNIELNVLIRPRAGDFLYSGLEFEIMLRDIELCRASGVNGIVTGILNRDGTIDIERTSRLVEMAYPMSVTFHRAFDMCIDPGKGLEDIITTGAARLLTSGQCNSAEQGAKVINALVRQGGDKIIIMPGSGISENNIEKIARITGAHEFHMSARKVIGSEMAFRRNDLTMGNSEGYDEFARKVADPDAIRKVIKILKEI